MNSIFGRKNFNKESVNQTLFNKGLDQLLVFKGAKKEIHEKNDLIFGQIGFPPFNNNSVQTKHANLILVSDSSIYNKQELAGKLNIAGKQFNDDNIILLAFEKWGKHCVNYLLGDFTFAIWDSETEEIFCARDHFGVKPFNYYIDEKCFVFSSDIPAILTQDDLYFSIDKQQVADSISIIKSETFRTSYNEIKKLPPAHTLTLNKNNVELKQYWELKPQKTILKKDIEIVEEFKELIIESVKCRTGDQKYIGTELSGGVDSSSITAIASKFSHVKTFSHVLPDHLLGKIYPYKDEREFIKHLCDFCNIQDCHFITSEVSFINAIKQNVSDFKSLTQQGFGMFSDQLYQFAMKESISVLLSGFGGDEVASSKSSGYLLELAKNKEWKDLKTDIGNQSRSKIKFIKSIIKLYLKSRLPFIIKIIAQLKFEKQRRCAKFKTLALNPSFAKKMDIKNQYLNYYIKPQTFYLQEKNIERITHPHVSQRLEYCSLIARKYGIEYRYPLLDKRLIEYFLAIPTRLKARNGIDRYAIRKAMEGIIPEKIQWRNDKSGATIPTVFMRMLNDKEKIDEIINRAKLNPLTSQFIDFNKYEKWFNNLCQRSKKEQKAINPGAFHNYLKLILFIEQNPSLFQ